MTKVMDGDWERPWQVLRASFANQRSIPAAGSRAVVLALVVLEAVRNAATYEDPSTIYIPDAHLAELLWEQRRSWNMTATAAGQIHRRILKTIQPRFNFRVAEAKHRSTSDPDWHPREIAMWLAYQTASQSSLENLSAIIHIDDRIVDRTFETIMARDLAEDYIHWVHDESYHPSLHQLPNTVSSARCLEALLDRDQDRARRLLPAYWFSNTIPYAVTKE